MEFEFKSSYFKDFKKLPKKIKVKIKNLILNKLTQITNIIDFPSIKKIKRTKNFYRIRIGEYRIGF